jgi:hypothetical protein
MGTLYYGNNLDILRQHIEDSPQGESGESKNER